MYEIGSSPRRGCFAEGIKLMIETLKSLFSDYSLQARLYPALLVLLPPLLMLIAWFPKLVTSTIIRTLVTFVVSCGLLFFLADFSRSVGAQAQERLLADWGGWPTTLWLRHSDTHLNETTKARYHAFLARHLPDVILPTADQERQNPKGADKAYSSAVDWLREQCRGTGIPQAVLVLNENIDYGFRRNMLGLRPFALWAIAATFIASVAAIIYRTAQAGHWSATALFKQTPVAVYGAMTGLLIALVCWVSLVRDEWVLAAGNSYARALLACCDALK
jgi:hypothetical protein